MTKFTRTVDTTIITGTIDYKHDGELVSVPFGELEAWGQLAPKKAANYVKHNDEVKKQMEEITAETGVTNFTVTANCRYETSKYYMDVETFIKYATKEGADNDEH